MTFLVLGAGAQGSAAALDLLREDPARKVVLADAAVARPRPFLTPFLGDRLSLVQVDARDEDALRSVMDGVDAVVCALPYFFNEIVSRLAVEQGKHCCDLGGNTEIVGRQRTLDAAAKAAGVSVIPDCGLAPGMVNILAQAGIDAMDEVDSVRILVGGLPRHPQPPLNYQIVYSMQGVLDYYTTPSIVLEDGRLTEKEALSEVETVEFPEPVGRLEAFHTAGGISSMPHRYAGRIPRMEYKTLRYPGHAELMRAIRDLGLISREPVTHNGSRIVPRDVFINVVSPKLRSEAGEDLVALRVTVEGRRGGEERRVRYEMLDVYDAESGVTAMMRTTGYSLAITSVMQVEGRVRALGVRTPDEVVPAEDYLAALAERGVGVQRTS